MLTLEATQISQPLPQNISFMEEIDISETIKKVEEIVNGAIEMSKLTEQTNSLNSFLSEQIDRQWPEHASTSKLDCTSILHRSRGFAGSPEKCETALLGCPEDSVVRRITDAVGGVESFCKFPVLTLDRDPKNTIDIQNLDDMARRFENILDIQINPSALSDSLMRGVAPFGRNFIALKAQDGQEENVEVFFQHRPEDSESWVRRNPHDPLNCDGFIANDKESFEKLARLAVSATDHSENKSQ